MLSASNLSCSAGLMSSGRMVPWATVEAAKRWSIIIRPGQAIPTGHIELGELCRVHRGQVTGDNSIWIAGDHAKELPASVLTPTVTKARDQIGRASCRERVGHYV